jgi:kynurenine formamidase
MHPSLWLHHLEHCNCTRRSLLGLAGAAGTASALAPLVASAAEPHLFDSRRGGGGGGGGGTNAFNDVVFDYANPANLSNWTPSRYGAGDQRGAFNEVTEDKTTRALRRTLDRGRAIKTYNLGELMFNGFPAFVTTPSRGYQQRATVTGYTPPANFVAGGGYVTSLTPIGSNQVSVHEERFPSTGPDAPAGSTFQIGTQLDNLNHIGAGPYFYNGFLGPDILRSYGTTRLGSEHMGPIVTRGVLLDVLGAKLARRQTSALGAPALNGKPVLLDNYRITVDDIFEAMEFGRIRSIEAGDVVLFRTGWNQLLRSRNAAEFTRWGAQVGEPGIWLREARFLASFRPAIIASDTWALEVLGRPDITGTSAFAVHQDLLMRYGIRIGESVVSDELAEDRVYEFAYIVTPQYSEGATAGNTPPVALGQPRGR